MNPKRKYLPTLSELIDRLSIVQLKEVFIPDHKDEYSQEISDICHDINMLLSNSENIDADFHEFGLLGALAPTCIEIL